MQPSHARSFTEPEPVNPAFVALQAETGAALDCLARAPLGAEDVHAARKALKKSRAALRLLRPVLAAGDYREVNVALRDAGRCLSPLRDASMLLQALAAIAADDSVAQHAETVGALRHALGTALAAARDGLSLLQARRRCAALIEAGRQFLARRSVAQAGADAMGRGLGHQYRKARRAFARARADAGTSTLHEWRKQTKYLHNAAALLQRAGAGGVRALSKASGDIAEWLGDDHDFAVLEGLVRADPALSHAGAQALVDAIGRRRGKLQRQALDAGTTLFAAKPRRVAANLDG